jgi:hypothetical protein
MRAFPLLVLTSTALLTILAGAKPR